MSYFADVTIKSLLDTGNSSTTLLGANEVFTGEWIDTLKYGTGHIGIVADKDSALDGLDIQYSADGITEEQNDRYSIYANISKTFSVGMACRYMRVVYTNGAIAQTHFDLQTIFKGASTKNSTHRINDNIVGEDDAELMKSVITGIKDDGVFGNCMLDNENNLRVSSFDYLYAIAEDAISGHTALLKFGTRTSVAANTESLIWEGTAATYTYLTSAEQLKVSSSSAQDGVGGTGILTLTLIGLDANFLEISETVTMNGITAVTTTNSFIRIFRAYGATSGSSTTNVGIITVTNNAGTNQLLVIPVGDGQTLMTLWTIPAGKVAYLLNATISTDTNKGARFSLRTRLLDGGIIYPWLIKYRAYVFGGNEDFPFKIPFKIPAKTDIEIRLITPAAAGTTSAGATFELWYEDV